MKETKKGLLIVVTGPAGSGKGTVLANIVNEGDCAYSVSATTRKPRPGEIDGVNYHFMSVDEFKRHIENNDFLEHIKQDKYPLYNFQLLKITYFHVL